MRLIKYYPNTNGIHQHYCQTGGGIPVFAGSPIQQGSGLGNLLSGLVRSALPILKKTVLPAAVRTGKEVLSDVITKKRGFKQALLQSGKNRISELLETPPVTGKKRKRSPGLPQTSKKRKKFIL